MYQWVLEVYFRMGRKKGLHSAYPTRIRLLDKLKSRASPPHLKITQKVTSEQNIPVWRATVLVSFYQDVDGLWVVVQQMCRWSVYFILIVLLIEIIMIWTTPVMFLRNLSIFCLRRATFFYCFDARGRKERSIVIETSDVF